MHALLPGMTMAPDPLPNPGPDDWTGRQVGGKYRILHLLGRGGMGAVYEAENLALGKRVAIKFIDVETAKNPDGVQRFLREARAASSIESAHIVQVFDVAELDDGRPYIVMELLRGENLGARLYRLGRLNAAETVHVAVHVLRGLHRAHDAGIIHRDLKPDNIFLVHTDDDPMFAKIVDFGISKFVRSRSNLAPGTLTQQGVVLGTPHYMAPAQAQALADLDHRADLWALGAILYECLTGTRPFGGDTYEQVIIAICTQPPLPLRSLSPDVPQPVVDVVMRALTRDRDRRFADAKDFLQALREASPELVAAVPPSYDPTTKRRVDAPAAESADKQPSEPRTDVSWSSVDADLASPSPARAAPAQRSRLALVGGASALLAFALTIAVILRLQPSPQPAHVVSSQATPGSPVAPAGVDTNAADAPIVPLDPIFSASAAASEGPPPSASKAPSTAHRASRAPATTVPPESSSLTGGLELKTDLP